MVRTLILILCLSALSLLQSNTYAQLTVSGTVYDITKKNPIEAVSVLSTSGNGTFTDSTGYYSLTVSERDSIYFSYLNKATPKYPVNGIGNLSAFDISIQKKVLQLPNVFVKQRNYRIDSLQNRLEYQKIFNYKKPGLSTSSSPSPGNVAVGLDLDELINMFKFRKNKRMVAFQNRLVREEQEKYISHRFNKGLVRKLTGLKEPQIDSFMAEFRPTLEMVTYFNDLELGQFVMEAFKYYQNGVKINRSMFRKEYE